MLEFDILVMGSGPAGLQAAIHAARRKTKVAIMGKAKMSLLAKTHFENFCCMDRKRNGMEFLNEGIEQAKRLGAIVIEEDVIKIEKKDEKFYVTIESDREFIGEALVIATGIRRNKLGIKGESELIGKGVSYCTECDANFFKGKNVAVIGDGSAAVHSALLLMYHGNHVYLICRELKVEERLAE